MAQTQQNQWAAPFCISLSVKNGFEYITIIILALIYTFDKLITYSLAQRCGINGEKNSFLFSNLGA